MGRVNRIRLLEASKAYQMEVQSLFDLRMEQKKQAEKEARETYLMEIEDVMSLGVFPVYFNVTSVEVLFRL